MADSLSVLFSLRAQNQASPVVHQVQSDVNNLTKSASSDFSALSQVSTAALGKVTQSLTNFSGQLPVVGNAVSGLTSELTAMGTSTAAAGTEFAAIAGPIGAAVIGMAAMVAGVVKLGEALFATTKAAAEAQGKFFDLSQQTGVSVETLSALDLLAKTTGGSIDSLAQSLVVFQGNLEASQDSTSKQAEQFRRLGVETNNTEEALRQTLLAISKMPEGFTQTNEAAELFGRRGGKQFLAILKEAHGDIDQTIRELQAMGLANSDNARRSDEFNDQLVKLQTQILGISVTIGNQAMPQILSALQELEKALKNNQEAINALAVVVKALTFLFVQPFKGAIVAVVAPLRGLEFALRPVVELYERLAAAVQLVSGRIPKITGNEIPAQSTGGSSSGLDLLNEIRAIVRATPPTKSENPLANIPGLVKDTGSPKADPAIQLLKQLQSELRNLEGATKAESIAAELLDSKFKNINPKIKEQILLIARAIDLKKDQAEVDKQIEELQRERKQAIDAEIKSLSAFIEAQTRSINGQQTAGEETEEFILRFENLSKAMDENQKFWLRFNAAIIDSVNNLKALKETFEDVVPDIDLGDRIDPKATPGNLPIDVGEPPENISVWEEAMGALRDQMESFSDFLDNTFVGSLFGVADALAQGVEAWALYGGSFAQAMKQSLAALAAKIAAEATFQAALHAAYAIASLAFGDFGSAAQHALAAAKFGALAAGAALGARAIAGGAFSQQGAGNGGSGSSNTSRPKNQQTSQPTPIEIPRSAVNQQAIVHTLEYRVKGDAVVEAFVQDYDLNGRTRIKIISDGQG